MTKTTLTIVWDHEPTKRALIHALCGVNRNQPNTRQYPMFIQPQYRFEPEGPELLVFGTHVNLLDSTLDRVVRMYDKYKLRHVGVMTDGVSQDSYHEFVDKLQSVCPDVKVFDPTIQGLIIDQLKSEIGDA